MTKENFLGKIVTLNEKFLLEAYGFDDNVPTKPMRPYLIVELEKEENAKQLYAIPMQSSIGDIDNNKFYTRLPRRLTAKMNSESGFIYSQMIPITVNQIDSLKESEDMVPYKNDEKLAVIYNLKTVDVERVPEKVRTDFIAMKKMAYAKYDIFTNDFFREKYSKVANEIFQETIRVKNKMYENILEKAQNYLSIYKAFRQQLENKRKYGDYQGKRIRLPKYYVKLDKMYNFIDAYNSSVKTSLQNNPIADKYGLTEEQYDIAKKFAEKFAKPLEQVIRSNIAFAPDSNYDSSIKSNVITEEAAKRKQQNKTQEKNISKPVAVKTKKSNQDQNSR